MKTFVLKQKAKTSTKKDISQKIILFNYLFLTNSINTKPKTKNNE